MSSNAEASCLIFLYSRDIYSKTFKNTFPVAKCNVITPIITAVLFYAA